VIESIVANLISWILTLASCLIVAITWPALLRLYVWFWSWRYPESAEAMAEAFASEMRDCARLEQLKRVLLFLIAVPAFARDQALAERKASTATKRTAYADASTRFHLVAAKGELLLQGELELKVMRKGEEKGSGAEDEIVEVIQGTSLPPGTRAAWAMARESSLNSLRTREDIARRMASLSGSQGSPLCLLHEPSADTN